MIGAGGRLANALVSLVPLQGQDPSRIPPPQVPGPTPGPVASPAEEDAGAAVLTLKDGLLTPRVQVVKEDGKILVHAEDEEPRIQGKAGNWSFSTHSMQQRFELGATFRDHLWGALRRERTLKVWKPHDPAEVAWVVLVEEGQHRVTPRDGGFRFDGVPPGRYRIDVWHESGRTAAREVTLEPGVPARLEVELR